MTFNCNACQDTKKDSNGNDCFPCSINRRIERPDNRPEYTHEPTVRKEKKSLKPIPTRSLPPPKVLKKTVLKDQNLD